MRVVITDEEALRALSWKAVKAYLEAFPGGIATGRLATRAAVYQHTNNDGRLSEIAALTRDDLADYAARMGDAVGTLAQAWFEDRSVTGRRPGHNSWLPDQAAFRKALRPTRRSW